MFTYETEIKWHQTDAAGVLFFAHQFTLIHDAYQAMMQSVGFPLTRFLSELNFELPIVHAEADYQIPITAGDHIKICIDPAKFGSSSLSLAYRLINQQGKEVGPAQTVHVAVDKSSQKKINLPSSLASALRHLS
jgi:1,4-dihydroxy-2-naphthoyl-CoA hydrolase